MSKYIRNETGQFVCPTCGVTKEKQNTMYYHMKRHEEEMPHTCGICKKGFLQRQTLELHMRSKHADAPEKVSKAYACPHADCEFSAHTKGNCRTHYYRVHCGLEVAEILYHDKEAGTIECVGCDRTFSSLGLFYYHCSECISVPAGDERAGEIKTLLTAA